MKTNSCPSRFIFVAVIICVIITPRVSESQVNFASTEASGYAYAVGANADNVSGSIRGGSAKSSFGSNSAKVTWTVTPNSMAFSAQTVNSADASIDINVSGNWIGPTGPVNWKQTFSSNEGSGNVNPVQPFSNFWPSGDLSGTGFAVKNSGPFQVKIKLDVHNGRTVSGSAVWATEGEPFPPLPEAPFGLNYSSCTGCESPVYETGALGSGSSGSGPDAPIVGPNGEAFLAAWPVTQNIGVSQPLYFGGPSSAAPNIYSPSDYYFASTTELAFATFGTPDGIPGDVSNLMIDDGMALTPYVPGMVHTFSAPVYSFAIRGLDESAMPPDDEPVPFKWSATFDRPGTALIYETAYGVESLPGDFNRDGSIDAADYVIWRDTSGAPSGYNEWKSNFGVPNIQGSGSQATVPEPYSGALFLIGAAMLFVILRARMTHYRRKSS